jgi:F-type H+-transporting ATPase subunit b
MPQFDFHFFTPLFFWTVVSFGMLLFLLNRYAFPKILQFMEEREKQIRESLHQAEQARLEADRLRVQYEGRLKAAQQEVEAILEEARLRSRKLMEENQKRIELETRQMIEEAKETIQREQQQALREIQRTAVDLALIAAEKVLQRGLTDDDHRRFVEEAIKEAGRQKVK